ncbi:hypothetical protein JCM10449v2_005690 [Rhodotorula kratochvilovae]
MPPRARLLFVPAPPAPPPPLGHSALPAPPTTRDKPLPHPPPLHDTQGAFSLLAGGGVKVGERGVQVARGTSIERADAASSNDAQGAKGLRWSGTDERGVQGQWTLYLLEATEADLLAVHRILLLLPPGAPIPPVPFARPAPPPPTIRNSILLYDTGTRSVLAVLPLSPRRGPSPCPPLTPAPVPHPHNPPSPTNHPSAADFAAYVDHVATALHPSPTPQARCKEELAAREEVRRLAAEETADDELRLPPPPVIDFAARVEPQRLEPTGEEDQPVWRDERRQLAKGFARLDLETELACPREAAELRAVAKGAGAGAASQKSRPASSWTVSSFATYGTERFVTADEGEEDERDSASKRSSFSPEETFDPLADTQQTPRPTRLVLPPAPLAAPAAPAPAFDPSHTLTNGNAVLLSFLGAPSLLASSSSASAPARLAVTAHPLSAEQATEMELRGEIERAEVDVPLAADAAAERDEGGWWSWLAGLVGAGKTERSEEEEEGKKGWLGWLSLPALYPFEPAASASATAAGAKRRAPRTAGGEATSRLSVFHFDEAGTVRRAFVARG